MKTKSLLLVLSFATIIFRVPYCIGQSNVVFYGINTNTLSVVFVDTNLSSSARASIVSDLQLCLRDWGMTSELDLGAYEPGLAGYLYNFKRSPHYPEGIKFPKKIISSGTSGFALQVPKDLSDAYTNAFVFATSNSNIVAAAYEFVDFVSSSNFTAISSNSLPNYVLQKGVTTNMIVADAQEIISELRHQTYYPPSLLGFKYLDIGPSATNLWMRVPCSTTTSYSDTKEWSGYPAIWHDGKWKFCIWDAAP